MKSDFSGSYNGFSFLLLVYVFGNAVVLLSISPCAAAMQIYGTVDPVDLSKKTRQQLMHNYE